MQIDSPTSKAELEKALDEVVKQAHLNGVRVDNGGFRLLHDGKGMPNWDLQIVRMAKPGDGKVDDGSK